MRSRIDSRADVILASMPWEMLEIPSIQLGTLDAVLRRAGLPVATRAYKFDFIDRCIAATAQLPEPERLSAADYLRVANRCETALGDWIFAVPPYATVDAARDSAYLSILRRELGVGDELIALARRFREHVAPFVDECVEDLVASGARIVGFSSTFSQNIPSLLAAQCLKRRAPDVAIVFGGSNFDGPMGAAIHHAFPFVDFVVRGEGERVLPRLVRELLDGGPVTPQPGLCHRVDGRSVAEPEGGETVPMSEVPSPRFDEYFESFGSSLARQQLSGDVRLMYESSRGCWWGEKSHCTFCGLNGATMKFRSKDPEVVVCEIEALARRHQRLDFQLVDNIMDMDYVRSVLPRLRDAGFDLTLFYETKSNLRREHVALLAEAGVDRIQPGIESLSTPILKLMKKGVTAFQNIRLLKWGAEYGVGIYWNIICGFPREPETEYARMAELVPLLTHLDAPEIGTLRVDRFSPYHKDPARYGLELLGPRAHFEHLYAVEPAVLVDLAYTFEYRHVDGRSVEGYSAPLRAAVKIWREQGAASSLTWRRGPGFVVVHDRRVGRPPNDVY
ncbi:MAG: RiPP maturation radical SAM C-methyltransferase, partial [Polyangia bacterium]